MAAPVFELHSPHPRAALGADGRKIGVIILHGGSPDYRAMAPLARVYAGKSGHKVVDDVPRPPLLRRPSRDRPGDTIRPDGTVRTPMWLRGEYITPDQYDVPGTRPKRLRYGTLMVARGSPERGSTIAWLVWPARSRRECARRSQASA